MQSTSNLNTTRAKTPNIPSHISVHNKSLYNDFVNSISYSNLPTTTISHSNPQRSRGSKSSNSYSYNKIKTYNNVNINNTNNNMATLNAKKLESKKKKILKYHSELEKWRKNDLKRTVQMIEFKKNKDEAEFRQRLNMIENRGGIYSQVSNMLYRDEMQHRNKVNNLHSNWNTKVYGPIIKHIKTMANDKQYMMKKKDKMRNLYDKYLKECNKNGNKIFLDSINVKEYDPFEWEHDDQQLQIQKIKQKIKIHDPLKSDLNKYIVEQKISNNTSKYFNNNNGNDGNSVNNQTMTMSTNEFSTDTVTNSADFDIKSNTFSLKPHTRYCIAPQKYNHVSHLPLFRDMEQLKKNERKCILPSHIPGGNVLLNQKEIPKYDPMIVRKQYFPQTKRIVRPAFTKYEFKISEMW